MRPTRTLPALVLLGTLLVGSPSGADPAPPTGSITVRQSVTCCYLEGSVSYVTVRDADTGAVVASASQTRPPLVTTLIDTAILPAGRYRISSYQRECEGNCDHLSAPVETCRSGVIELGPDGIADVRAHVVPFVGCRITASVSAPSR